MKHGAAQPWTGFSFPRIALRFHDRYVCWSSRSVLTVSDEWCIGCAGNGTVVKHYEQCKAFALENGDGTFTCLREGTDGTTCADGDDDQCAPGYACAHGPGGYGGPLGGDPDAGDDVLYPSRRDSAEDFSRLNALLFTAMAWILIPAYCFAVP